MWHQQNLKGLSDGIGESSFVRCENCTNGNLLPHIRRSFFSRYPRFIINYEIICWAMVLDRPLVSTQCQSAGKVSSDLCLQHDPTNSEIRFCAAKAIDFACPRCCQISTIYSSYLMLSICTVVF